MAGFMSFPQPVDGDKVRGKPERFADHYTQATLFWNSQTPAEKAHIVNAFRFELTRTQTPAIRERVVSMLVNVDADLAQGVAQGLGMKLPAAQPKALPDPVAPEVTNSPALSLRARPGDRKIRTRRVAILVSDGVDTAAASTLKAALAAEDAEPRFVGMRLGTIDGGGAGGTKGSGIEVDVTFETMPSVLFDAVAIPGGRNERDPLAKSPDAIQFVSDQYRHCKPILVMGHGKMLAEAAGVKAVLQSGEIDSGVLIFQNEGLDQILPQFMESIAAHRHFDREADLTV
jgi:catalase